MARATVKRALRWSMVGVIAGCAQGLVASSREQGELTRFTFTEYHMGIDARLVVYTPSEKEAIDACEAAYKRIAALEAVMSDYRPDSELMKLCSHAGEGPVPVSEDLFRVLERSQIIARQSDGAFDVTVGPLVQLWRKARKEKKLPLDADIEAAKGLVGWEKLVLDPKARTAALALPGMRLDLGGIGKGFASDEALKVLRKVGVKSALIETGGDLVLGDAPPKTAGWRVEIPNAVAGGKALSPLPPTLPAPKGLSGVPVNTPRRREGFFKNCAISSSGDTEQFVEIDGVRYSHVVDPKTGKGISKRVQATVIAKDGFTSDPLSTALTILDEGKRKRLLSKYPGVKVFIKTAS